MLRFLLIALFIGVFLIITIPVDIILHFVKKSNKKLHISICRKVIDWTFRVILWLAGADIETDGKENIPEGACLFVGNHRSYVDILATYINIDGGVGFISKIEMDRFPLFNLWMRGINCLFLDRSDIRQGLKTILKGVEELKEGYSMFIFPEGTRNQEKEMLPFKEGSTKMAEKAKVPIVPVAITGTDDIFENNHGPIATPAKIRISFGKPIIINELEKEEKKFLGAYTQNIIKEMLKSHK
jgi:1-acyl-sn-glycerol-3-phosphate acyltransferase